MTHLEALGFFILSLLTLAVAIAVAAWVQSRKPPNDEE